MSEHGRHMAPKDDAGSRRDETEVSKEDADRLKKDSAEAAGMELPGEDPEDNPDLEGEDRFDAG
ncbi:hypothetical protein GCM10010413_29380 [Promicromonospora sukumoe]|uniref:Uncharacterized protein n=1 Tax=Promicromonospora sukumoe TaxID=88382 RepID=A0A7W3PD92_9MICO|nr:hypothetical protein [Promicromonospora sukumoe]MBA8807269.1 hypothetical protein [Promicromonospora sukumoe]